MDKNIIISIVAIIVATLFIIVFGILRTQKDKRSSSLLKTFWGQLRNISWASAKKKIVWVGPIIIWLLLLLLFWVVEPEYFDWWFSHPQLFWGGNLGLLLIGLLWRTEASTLGKKWVTTAIALILVLGFTKALGTGVPSPYSWEELKNLLTPPHQVTQVAAPSADTGVPWTRGICNGKDGFVCTLKPGESSKLLPILSSQFRIDRDCDLYYIIDGSAHLVSESKGLSASETSRMGLNGFGTTPHLRFKLPEYWPNDEETIQVVFQ